MSESDVELTVLFRAGCINAVCILAAGVRYIGSATLLQTYRKVRVVVSCAEDLGFDDQLGGWLAGFLDFSTPPPSSPVSICKRKSRTHVTDLIQEIGSSDSELTFR
jgi:hypothetical protein